MLRFEFRDYCIKKHAELPTSMGGLKNAKMLKVMKGYSDTC